MCRPPTHGRKGPFLSALGQAPTRACLSWHVEHASMNIEVRRILALLVVLAALGSLSWLVYFLRSDLPSPQQACTQKCADIKKDGYLVYRGPVNTRDLNKDAYSECECR